MKSEVKWQNGDPLYEGWYLTTIKISDDEIEVIVNYYFPCDGWSEHGEIIAFCPVSEIEPYVEPKFKIGEFVVENGILGIVTRVNKDNTYIVVGCALIEMMFHNDMCRLATSEEALLFSARLRERGVYYDIKDNSFKRY